MSGGVSLGLVADIAVAGLLAVTIAYCTVLNRRLKRLRADEAMMRQTIGELLAATDSAERSVRALRTAAGESDRTLGQRLRAAELCAENLGREVAAGERLYERLATLTRAARADAPRPAAAAVPFAPTAPAPQPLAVVPAPPHAPGTEPGDARALRKAASEAVERLRAARRANRGAAA